MTFDARDPRATLAAVASRPSTVAAAADYVEFFRTPAHNGTYFARGQNFVVAYTDAAAGAQLARTGQADEYVLLLPDPASRVEITTPDERVAVDGQSLVVLPPGDSTIRVTSGGRLVRVFTDRATDLLSLCSNAASYAEQHPHVGAAGAVARSARRFQSPALQPERAARRGPLRSHLALHDDHGQLGRAAAGPRDVTKMSPHSHPDFEQCSLVLEGEFVHHLRWPWTTSLNDWRADDHVRVGSPSVTVIPPTSIHTSQAIGRRPTTSWSTSSAPPRLDFSEKPGWVLNAAEYPMP